MLHHKRLMAIGVILVSTSTNAATLGKPIDLLAIGKVSQSIGLWVDSNQTGLQANYWIAKDRNNQSLNFNKPVSVDAKIMLGRIVDNSGASINNSPIERCQISAILYSSFPQTKHISEAGLYIGNDNQITVSANSDASSAYTSSQTFFFDKNYQVTWTFSNSGTVMVIRDGDLPNAPILDTVSVANPPGDLPKQVGIARTCYWFSSAPPASSFHSNTKLEVLSVKY